MKRFLRHIAWIVLPVIAVAIGLEIAVEAIPNSYTYKRQYMERHGGEIKTLILGSSNAYDGLCPEVFTCGAFNLANSSQTLEDDYRLLARYIDTMDSLETVIVGLGYHSLGATTEENRRTYYTIYMGLYPRWPISKYSFEVFDQKMMVKKIIKYVVSQDVTRCDSLGQRVGHTKAAVEGQREFWNKDAEELAARDRMEWYKNTKNTVEAAINKDKEKKNDIKNTESSTDTDRILTSINQQSVNEQDSFLASAQSCSTDIAAQSLSDDSDKNTKNNTLPIGNVECLQKCVVPTSENIKNNSTSSSNKYGSEVIARNVGYLREIIELCEGNGVKPVIVTMPAKKEYKEALPEEQIELHDAVMRELSASAVYIDASDWEIAEDGWYNATHLTREESVEFTERLRDTIAALKETLR